MSTLTIDKAGPRRKVKYGSMSRDRAWALRWSYFFLTLFAIFSLGPLIYMLITSLNVLRADGVCGLVKLPEFQIDCT